MLFLSSVPTMRIWALSSHRWSCRIGTAAGRGAAYESAAATGDDGGASAWPIVDAGSGASFGWGVRSSIYRGYLCGGCGYGCGSVWGCGYDYGYGDAGDLCPYSDPRFFFFFFFFFCFCFCSCSC